jgi:hypothetical protein
VEDLIKAPASVPEILGTNLPTAANYFFSFLVLQALSISASSILQTIRLLNFYVFGKVNTPDQTFNKLSFTWRTRIGSNIPWYTTFCVIVSTPKSICPRFFFTSICCPGVRWMRISWQSSSRSLMWALSTKQQHTIKQRLVMSPLCSPCFIGHVFSANKGENRGLYTQSSHL